MKKFFIVLALLDIVVGLAVGMVTPIPMPNTLDSVLYVLIIMFSINWGMFSLANKLAFGEWLGFVDVYFEPFGPAIINLGLWALIVSLHIKF